MTPYSPTPVDSEELARALPALIPCSLATAGHQPGRFLAQRCANALPWRGMCSLAKLMRCTGADNDQTNTDN